MRLGWLLVVALLVVFLAPRDATAAEAPAVAQPDDASVPESRGPIEKPEDWIAVVGIVCYSVIPALAIMAIGIITYRWIAQGQASLFLPAEQRNAWMWRSSAGIPARPPPEGLVLLRF